MTFSGMKSQLKMPEKTFANGTSPGERSPDKRVKKKRVNHTMLILKAIFSFILYAHNKLALCLSMLNL